MTECFLNSRGKIGSPTDALVDVNRPTRALDHRTNAAIIGQSWSFAPRRAGERGTFYPQREGSYLDFVGRRAPKSAKFCQLLGAPTWSESPIAELADVARQRGRQ